MKRGFNRKSDAIKFESEYKLKSNASSDMSFKSLVDDYMEDSSHRLRETTMANKK